MFSVTLFYPFLISFIISLLVIKIAHKHSFFIDCPKKNKPQRFHLDSTPRAGGIGIISGLFFLLAIPFGAKTLPAAFLAFLSGIFEDFHNSLSAKFRLFLQVVAVSFTVWFTNSVVTYLGLGITLPYWIGVIFSIIAIVGMMNAINMIDGFNGLASGVVLLILFSLGFVSYQHHDSEILSVILVNIGAILGFFILVFPRGKIFLGDGGAYLLGFMVAIIGIYLANKYDTISPWYILAIFIYPVWEVIFSIVRKKSIGLSPLKPDRYHFHMLVFRQFARSNPLTAIAILLFVLPFIMTATYYANCSKCNLYITILFILLYTAIYLYLYKKDKQDH